jgi:hypothetical protein
MYLSFKTYSGDLFETYNICLGDTHINFAATDFNLQLYIFFSPIYLLFAAEIVNFIWNISLRTLFNIMNTKIFLQKNTY